VSKKSQIKYQKYKKRALVTEKPRLLRAYQQIEKKNIELRKIFFLNNFLSKKKHF